MNIQNKVTIFNHMQIWYETFGNKSNPAVLLMMGNSCDAIMWPDIFCQSLAERDYYVIRFDQRDTGLSSWIDFAKEPYTLMDMVDDAIGLLDALNIQKAHIVGFSTGGLIAQLLTIHFSQRVLSLILMMSSIDLTIKNDAFRGIDMSSSKLPPPKQEFIQAILHLNAVQPSSLPEKIKQLVENFRLANGSKSFYDEEFFYQLFERSLKRVDGKSRKVGHESNHALATSATPIITEQKFATVSKPTLVIAGSEDPIFPPAHAEAMVKAIPYAQLLLIEKMGHILNPVFFLPIIDAVGQHMLEASLHDHEND
jgi:pimeloyl-ACP methyl ester carboxylesterase